MQNRIDGILLKSQQAYLKLLGYYEGAIDGFWGTQTKAAMLKFRDSTVFLPANKNRGDTPFVPFERLPKGYYWGILDGQRCMMAKSTLPASFAVQELVNLILKPTTAKVEKTSPVAAISEKLQTTNLGVSSVAATEATKTEADIDTDVNLSLTATEGHSAKGSSTQFQKSGQNQQQQHQKR